MSKIAKVVRSTALVAALAAACTLPRTAAAQKDSTASQAIAAQQNQSALAQNEVPQTLLVLHADKGGNIARQQFSNSPETQTIPAGTNKLNQSAKANLLARTSAVLGK